MDESRHCALSGEGALKIANSLENFDDICNPEDLKGGNDCPNQRKGIRNSQLEKQSGNFFMGRPIEAQEGDTVGAVAIDSNGYLACANSAGIVNSFAQVVQTHLVVKLGYLYTFFFLTFDTMADSQQQHMQITGYKPNPLCQPPPCGRKLEQPEETLNCNLI